MQQSFGLQNIFHVRARNDISIVYAHSGNLKQQNNWNLCTRVIIELMASVAWWSQLVFPFLESLPSEWYTHLY